jgi:hypothetical protein
VKTIGSPVFAALPASAAAGPVFLLSLLAAQAYAILPEPVAIEAGGVAGFMVIALVPTIIVGFLISFVPNAIGAYVLSKAGETSETARAPIFWVGAGAMLGFGAAVLFGAFQPFASFQDSAPVIFALVLTSAVCAGLCRARTRWED